MFFQPVPRSKPRAEDLPFILPRAYHRGTRDFLMQDMVSKSKAKCCSHSSGRGIVVWQKKKRRQSLGWEKKTNSNAAAAAASSTFLSLIFNLFSKFKLQLAEDNGIPYPFLSIGFGIDCMVTTLG